MNLDQLLASVVQATPDRKVQATPGWKVQATPDRKAPTILTQSPAVAQPVLALEKEYHLNLYREVLDELSGVVAQQQFALQKGGFSLSHLQAQEKRIEAYLIALSEGEIEAENAKKITPQIPTALSLLSFSGGPQEYSTLCLACEASEIETQKEAFEAIGFLGLTQSLPLLIDSLKQDLNDSLKVIIGEALQRITGAGLQETILEKPYRDEEIEAAPTDIAEFYLSANEAATKEVVRVSTNPKDWEDWWWKEQTNFPPQKGESDPALSIWKTVESCVPLRNHGDVGASC